MHPRLAPLTVTVRDPQGRPRPGVPVTATPRTLPLAVGTCLAHHAWADPVLGPGYRAFAEAVCQVAVGENEWKWYHTDPEGWAGRWADAEALWHWCHERGIAVRGHCLTWDKARWVPAWVRALPAPQIMAAVYHRIGDATLRWRGRVTCWDACNELLDGGWLEGTLGVGSTARLLQAAQRYDSAPLFVNEYGILDSDEKLGRYLQLIAGLRAQGAPVGGIGIQEHAAERCVVDAAAAAAEADRPERQGRGPLIVPEMHRRFDRLAVTGLPIHLTEVSVKTPDLGKRAEALGILLDTAWDHPAVEVFMLWGFHPQVHWLKDDAALTDAGGQPNRAGQVLLDRLARWKALVHGTTGADGTCTLAVPRGRLAIATPLATVEADHAAMVSVTG